MFWYAFSLIQAYFIIVYSPIVGRFVMSKVHNCIADDVQNGEIQSFLKIQFKENGTICEYLPFGYLITRTQYFAIFVVYLGVSMIIELNLVYWVIYRLELPFFEQYRVFKEEPWPWKADPEGWRQKIIKAFLYCVFNNFFVNIGMLVIYSWLYNW